MLQDGFERIIGLDPSLSLLQSTKARLTKGFYPIQAVAENIPLKTGIVAGVIACFSLRDVRDRAQTISEFSRVTKDNGLLEIVDVGKPDNRLIHGMIRVYVSSVMPLIARVLIGRRGRANPFRMIIPTFHNLSTNHALKRQTAKMFGSARLDEFLLGGLLIVEGEHSGS